MKSYSYIEPIFSIDGEHIIGNKKITMTEEEIIASYFDHWCYLMHRRRYNDIRDMDKRISHLLCIDDWVLTYHAVEVRPTVWDKFISMINW